MQDFIITIDADGDGFGLRAERRYAINNVWTSAVIPRPDHPALCFDASPLLGEPLDQVQEAIRAAIQGRQDGRMVLRQYGDRLYREVFRGTIGQAFRDALAFAGVAVPHSANDGVRLRIRGHSSIRGLPWELLYRAEARPPHFLWVDPKVSLVRSHIDAGDVNPGPIAGWPLRILVVAATPLEHGPIQVRQEIERLLTAMEGLIRDGRVLVDFVHGPNTAQRLAGLTHAYHIWHFIGHGAEAPAGGIGLVFEDANRAAQVVGTQGLWQLALALDRPRLFVLNVCSGAATADAVTIEGYDLRLMSSVRDVSGIPTEGKSLVIVADVGGVLSFRTFDGGGKKVVDTDEKRLTGRARQIEELRKALEGLWPPHDLTRNEKDRALSLVTFIVGQPPPEAPFASLAESLLLSGVNAVVAHQFEVSDQAAQAFSRHFYTQITQGCRVVDVALTAARRLTENDLPGTVECHTPVLFLDNSSGELFAVNVGGAQAAAPRLADLIDRARAARRAGLWSEAAGYAREALLVQRDDPELKRLLHESLSEEELDEDIHQANYAAVTENWGRAMIWYRKALEHPALGGRPPAERGRLGLLEQAASVGAGFWDRELQWKGG